MSPCFSNTNLMLRLDSMNEAINNLIIQLSGYAQTKESIDIAKLMLHFNIDFLTVTMFSENFNCSKDFEKPVSLRNIDELSEGKLFLNELSIGW